ncbi:FtsX-like permease family protein [Kitasatospora sp. NPDC048239]|uniref:FtsX-like permease family protein n=1 Tax=Kitasatospora sp. NPDC048239 TaxID=3364046 RepID=UPI0037240255
MFRLALQTLRFRKGGFTASVIALFFGAVLLTACGALMETGIRNDLGPGAVPAALTGHHPPASRLISMSAVFGGIAAMVTVFVVGSTLALLVQQRLGEMALLRAIGSLPGQIRRMVVIETLVVALGAIALALWPGRLAGRWMLGRIAGSGVVPARLGYHAGWIPMATAGGTALLAALAAAFIASRRAALARPADALAEARLQDRWLSTPRLVFAVLCLAGGTALAVVTATVMNGEVAASTAGPTAMLWAGGLALLAPGLTGVLTSVLRPPLRALFGLTGRLAMDNARARRIRMAGAVTPVMLATGLAVALIYLQAGGGGEAASAWINYLLAGSIIAYAVISLVNTVIVAAVERRREFAAQRLVGATRGQVLRMTAVESVLVTAVGTVLGTVVAGATLTPFGLALDGSWVPHGPVWIYLAIVAAVGVLTVAASTLAAGWTMRVRPAQAIASP